MKLCLVFPKTTVFEDPMVFPPLGLFYLRAVLEQAGHSVTLADMSEKNDAGPVYPTPADLPAADVYLVSGASPQASEMRKILQYLSAQGQRIIAGGPHVTNYAGSWSPLPMADEAVDSVLRATCDVLVKGEGERAVLEALERVEEGHTRRLGMGRGLVLSHPPVSDLGQIPIPNREDAYKYRYHLADRDGSTARGTTLFSSRGCPEECQFCDSPLLWGRAVRYVPVPQVAQELEQIKSLGFDAVHFFDDILPLHKGRMIQIADLLRDRFLWRCFFRVDIMAKYGKPFLQMLADAGLREALIGVESGSQAILDGIKKHTTVEQNTLLREWCAEVGIRYKASVILGLPGESRDTMEATKQWVLNNRPDKINLCVFIPFTGTPIVKDREHFDVSWDMDGAALDEHFYAGGWDTLKPVVSTSHVTAAEIADFYHGFIADLEREGISH